MPEQKDDGRYKLFIRLQDRDRRRLKWQVHKTDKTKQDIAESAIRLYLDQLERENGTDPDIEQERQAESE